MSSNMLAIFLKPVWILFYPPSVGPGEWLYMFEYFSLLVFGLIYVLECVILIIMQANFQYV